MNPNDLAWVDPFTRVIVEIGGKEFTALLVTVDGKNVLIACCGDGSEDRWVGCNNIKRLVL